MRTVLREGERRSATDCAPGLVLPLDEAGSGAERKARIAGLREGWAWAPRRWTAISGDTGVGDPSAATADKGAAFFRAVSERIGGFLVELAAADPDDLYGDARPDIPSAT